MGGMASRVHGAGYMWFAAGVGVSDGLWSVGRELAYIRHRQTDWVAC